MFCPSCKHENREGRKFCVHCGTGLELTCPSCGATSLERLISLFAVSSEGTNLRNRETLGAKQRVKAQANRKESEHYKHDHHDD